MIVDTAALREKIATARKGTLIPKLKLSPDDLERLVDAYDAAVEVALARDAWNRQDSGANEGALSKAEDKLVLVMSLQVSTGGEPE